MRWLIEVEGGVAFPATAEKALRRLIGPIPVPGGDLLSHLADALTKARNGDWAETPQRDGPPPIILPRRPALGTTTIFKGDYSVAREPGSVKLSVRSEQLGLTPDEARELAAVIAARADEADAEKGDVDALTDLLHALIGSRPDSAHAAKALLRAGYRPPERTP